MSKSTAPRSMLKRAIMPSALSAMSSANSGTCALSGTARKNAPSISGGISPSTSRSRTEISARRGKLLPMKWMVCGKAFIGPYSLPIPRGLTLTTVIIEGKGALLCARSKGGRVLKRTAEDVAHSQKAAMLHQLLKLTNRLMAPFSTHLSHRYKISLNEFRLLMTIGALERTASHELAELTGVNVMSVSRAVATLQRHGRIAVVRDARNRRRKWLTLTEEGQRLYQIMRPQSE